MRLPLSILRRPAIYAPLVVISIFAYFERNLQKEEARVILLREDIAHIVQQIERNTTTVIDSIKLKQSVIANMPLFREEVIKNKTITVGDYVIEKVGDHYRKVYLQKEALPPVKFKIDPRKPVIFNYGGSPYQFLTIERLNEFFPILDIDRNGNFNFNFARRDSEGNLLFFIVNDSIYSFKGDSVGRPKINSTPTSIDIFDSSSTLIFHMSIEKNVINYLGCMYYYPDVFLVGPLSSHRFSFSGSNDPIESRALRSLLIDAGLNTGSRKPF